MTLENTIATCKLICYEEADHFKVPPALIEIYLVRQLYARKKKRFIVDPFLKDGPLFKLLMQWGGPFVVLQDRRLPTLLFEDGSLVEVSGRRNRNPQYNWDDFIQNSYMVVQTETKRQIENQLKKRIDSLDFAEQE
ncbi:hypothetical protein [Chryseobacterium sp. 22543]|uniref:hypothetical protein n=1 Tax=Chryseobacterium sp. 22543 TaxID=3453940 RepID=UPI003F848507